MEKTSCEEHLKLLGRGEPGEILNILLQISSKPTNQLKIFNFYKEVPISSHVEILYVFGDNLICRANPAHTGILQKSNYTILRSPKLSNDVYAAVEYSVETDEITLSEFSFVEVLPDRRNALRVKVGGIFPISVEAGTSSFSAVLKDLSLGGCAIDVDNKALLGTFLYFYLNFTFYIKNYPEPQKLRVMSRLLRFETNEKPFRCIMLFEHDRRSENVIGMYIAQRQAEIIRELKE